MGNREWRPRYICVLIFGFFVSCASKQPVVIEPTLPPIKPPTETVPTVSIPISVPETLPPPMSTVDLAIQRIERNSIDINKYYILEKNGDITVKGEFSEISLDQEEPELFEVTYDMNFTSVLPADFGYIVPFTLKSNKTDTVLYDRFLWKPQKDSSGILLTFDDNFEKTWKNNFDLMDSYNAKATFFVQGEYSSFCQEALEHGHDIGFHTKSHLDLRKVSREVFIRETLSSAEAFRKAGIPLYSFAYPFGFFESWMNEELLKHYSILRGYGVTFRLYDKTQIRSGYISSKAIDNTLFKKDEDFMAAVDIMLRTVKFIGGNLVLPLTTHDISDTASYGIKPQRLEYLLKTANDLQLVFYTYKDLVDHKD
jgi:peptidoglycan/xylan/chitin deacetylase (PgdA/CDA1 family)